MHSLKILEPIRLHFPQARVRGSHIKVELRPNGHLQLSTSLTRLKFPFTVQHLFHRAMADHILKNSPLRGRHVRPYRSTK
jgi:hypothetical protein